MLLADVVATSEQIAGTSSRLAKRSSLADLLQSSRHSDDLEIAVAYLAGELRQRRTGLGWAALSRLPAPAAESALTLTEVDGELGQIAALAGAGSSKARSDLLSTLLSRATREEQLFLRNLVLGEIRQGALDAAMIDAIAAASGISVSAIRRAVMLRGATAPVAGAALRKGEAAVSAFSLTVGQPVRPMLAASAPDVVSAFDKLDAGATAAIDTKFDGVRVQVHKAGTDVRIFTRSLDEITARLPEVANAVRRLPVDTLILDGEALALDESGRPRPFQETASRAASAPDAAISARITPFFFDCLLADGESLIDRSLQERLRVLDAVVPRELVAPRLVTSDVEAGSAFFRRVVDEGQEGVVIKAHDSRYDAGRRGAAWIKVKPRHTLDLVVLAVEAGSGRRTGTLSNIHLGARDPTTGGFVMMGKTFKGMTDEMLRWQTERFGELEVSRTGHVVTLRPEQVVEIAFDGLQRSRRYPGGLALRFARVLRYRDDKSADEADTINTVRALAGAPNG